MNKLKLPLRGIGKKDIIIDTNENIYGENLKNIFRNNARRSDSYNRKIEIIITNGNVIDLKVSGNIHIDELNKWVYGTPGYKGNVTFYSQYKSSVMVGLPINISQEAENAIVASLKAAWHKYISGDVNDD